MMRGSRAPRTTNNPHRLYTIAFSSIVIGSCVLWQLIWMRQTFVERERYRVEPHVNANHNSNIDFGTKNNHVDEDRIISNKREEEKNQTTLQRVSQPGILLDASLIRDTLLREAPWAESHGANHLSFLGAGMLYYSMAYSFRSQTIVVLGSGGGFVPRMLKQAQRDLAASGVRPIRDGSYDLYLVDAHLASAGWGSTFYAENENTTMRKEFSDINYVFQLTDGAYENFFRPLHDNPRTNFTIDYLHVDADHGFEQSWKDFDNYSQLLSDRAVISFHDTCYDNVTRNCHGDGVPETIQKLKVESGKRGLQVMDMHYLYRGIAFAVRETAPALETLRDRRINFCVNNADLLHRTADGFTKNGRVGSLPTLGDFMDCSNKFNETELLDSKALMSNPFGPTNSIMIVPCPTQGFRRNSVTGRCDKCIPGLTGNDCQRSKYESFIKRVASGGKTKDEARDENDDILNIARAWLRSLASNPGFRSTLEVGPNGWKILRTKARESSSDDFLTSTTSLFLNSLVTAPFMVSDSSGQNIGNLVEDTIGDVIVVDPLLLESPIWVDPTVSSRHRVLPCTLKDAMDFDEQERSKKHASNSVSSSFSPLDLDSVDTLVCLSCDDLITMSSVSTTMKFLASKFPRLKTIIMGVKENEESNAFVSRITASSVDDDGEGSDKGLATKFRLDRDLTISLGATKSRKRLMLLVARKK